MATLSVSKKRAQELVEWLRSFQALQAIAAPPSMSGPIQQQISPRGLEAPAWRSDPIQETMDTSQKTIRNPENQRQIQGLSRSTGSRETTTDDFKDGAWDNMPSDLFYLAANNFLACLGRKVIQSSSNVYSGIPPGHTCPWCLFCFQVQGKWNAKANETTRVLAQLFKCQ